MEPSFQTERAILPTLVAKRDRPSGACQGGSAAQISVLKELVETELEASTKVDQLIAAAAAAAGAAPFQQAQAWVWPANGPVSQPFGPSRLSLEPPRTYHGVAYPNFHDGLDKLRGCDAFDHVPAGAGAHDVEDVLLVSGRTYTGPRRLDL